MRISTTRRNNLLVIQPVGRGDKFPSPTRLYEKDGSIFIAPQNDISAPVFLGAIPSSYRLINADRHRIMFVVPKKRLACI